MRSFALVIVAAALLSALGHPAARAETQSLLGLPRNPAVPPHDQPAKPPAPAPRTPVKTEHPAKTSPTPVVRPSASSHAHKPAIAAGAAAGAAAAGKAATAKTPAAKPPAAQPPEPAAPPATTTEEQPPAAETPAGPEKPDANAPKLPRFASLRSDDVNMRAGPGQRYRIDWLYRRRDLPVEIEREFDVWRWVRDPDGIQGWVHQATLQARRTFIIQHEEATMRASTSDTAAAVAVLKPGVIGRIRSCEPKSEWCEVQSGSYRGYLRRNQFWGLLPNEAVNP